MAQEYYDAVNTPRQWYYNNLESATASTASTFFANGASSITGSAFTLGTGTSTKALTKSLLSTTTVGNIGWNFLQNSATGANQSMNTAPWEWEFDYRNTTGAATDDPDAGTGLVQGKNGWRYWLQTYITGGVTCGLYVTVTGGNLQIRRKYDAAATQYQTLYTVALPNNTDTYQIRLVRSVTGYFNVYILDRTTGVTTTSLNLNLNYYSVYNLSYIDVASTTAGRFEFDNFNFYQVKAEYIPITDNGLTTTIYPGIVDAIPYAVNVNIRGDIQMGRYSLNMSANGGQPLFTSGAIYKTNTLNPITKAASTFLANFNSVNTSNTNYADMPASEYYYNPGNTNGTTANVTNYVFIFQGRNPFFNTAPTSVTFSVSTANTDTYSSFFQSVSPYTTASASSLSARLAVSSVSAPTVTGGATICGTATVTLTASGTSGATYNWYTAATGGTLLQSSTTATYSPFVANTTTYYVSATVGSNTSSRTAVTVTVNPKVATPLTSAVISYPFNNTYEDISGNKNDALSYGSTAPTAVNDRYGNPLSALNFNGTTQYLSSSITNYNPQTYSLSLWFRTTSTQGGKLIGFVQQAMPGQSGQFDRHIYMSEAGKLYFGVYINGYKNIITNKAYNDGLWHHVVVTVAPSTATAPLVAGAVMYVDGVSVGSNTAITGGEPHNGYWRIGGDNLQNWTDVTSTTSYFFNGDIDDVGVYYRPLTPTEATASNDLNLIGNVVAYCQNNTITLIAPTITGATYNWVDDANSSNTYTGNPGVFSNVSAGTYTLTVNVNGCTSSAVITPGSAIWTWTGGAGTTATNTATNWAHTSTGEVGFVAPPFTGTETIIIPAAATVFPALNNNISVYSLNIAPGAKLTLNNNTLNVGCNLFDKNTTASGILYGTTGNNNILNWNGTVANQAFYGSNTTAPAQVYRMTVNNTNTSGAVTIASGKIDIWNLLTITAGKLAITSPAELSLKSTTILNYAQIAPIVSGSIQGYINYEVMFQGGAGMRNYRSMGAPVYNNTTIYSTSNGSFKFSDLKSKFIITGSNGSANGFDLSSNNGATIRTYNATTNNYSFVSNLTNSTVSTGTGFFMYYRGDNINKPGNPTAADPFGSKTNKALGPGGNTYAIPESLTYTYKGIPNQGNITAATIPAGNTTSFYLLANPYAATLDADALLNSVPSNTIVAKTWVWNPSAATYAVYDKVDNNASTQGAKRYVVPGQGLFVKANNATSSAQTLTITESMKSINNSANAVRLLSTAVPTAEAEPPVMRLQLFKNSLIHDEIGLVFRATAKDSLDDQDAVYFSGDNMALTTITPDNKYLSIDKRPLNQTKKIIPLWVSAVTDSIYTFKNSFKSKLMSNYKVSLIDSFLNNTVEITNIDYAVNIYKAQPETWGRRFKLVIEQLPAPVTYYAFAGQLTPAKKGLLSWKTSEHRYGTTYQVQRSQDNKTFADIGAVQVGSTDSLKTDFNLTDNEIQKGPNYYRLVQTDVFGNKLTSNIVQLDYNLDAIPSSNGFKLYPNPVVDNFNIISDKTYTGKITLRIYDANSNLKLTKTVTQLSAYEPVQQYVSNFRLGVYVVEIRDDKNKVLTTLKFVKQ